MKFLFKTIYFVCLAALVAIPVHQSHFMWEPTYDSFYYYARTNEVINGILQIGNPYYFEHRNDLGISFFIPDWLSAIPGSFFIWPLINVLLIYLLIKNLGIKGWKLYSGTAFCYISVLYFIARPTSLQTIMPFFILFFLALIKYIKSSNNVLFFVISSSLSFYIYPYLWQVVAATLVFLVLLRRGSRWFLLIPILALPSLLYFWRQINAPYYWETMQRIGLIYTHIPTLDTISYFGMMTLPIIFLRKNLAFLIVYFSLTLILFSPILTGKELEISLHLARFIALFGALAIVVLINKKKIFILLALVWLILFRNNYYDFLGLIINPPSVPQIIIPDIVYQKKVIKAKGLINNYIPFMTNSYVLFHPFGVLHLMSSDEALERYLVWKYPDKLSVEILLEDFKKFSGVGRGAQTIGHYNYHVRICKLLHLPKCGEITNLYAYYGKDYFQKIIDRYYQDISPHIDFYYQKYHVDCIIDL